MKKFQLVSVFEDDHENCCNFTYGGEKFSLWWTNTEAIGAFEYDDSPRAQTVLKPISEVVEKMITIGEREYDSKAEEFRHTNWGFIDYGWGGVCGR